MNKQQKNIFLTGATGLIGSYLLKIFLKNNYKIYVLARGKANNLSKDRVREILKFWNGKVSNNYFRNVIVLEGDIRNRGLGLNGKNIELLISKIHEIFHCAASTKFNATLSESRLINVEGTRNVLDFARKCQNLKKINYISTAYVCGDHKGVFKENNLNVGQKFTIPYEQSKFEAEKLVGKYRKNGLWIDVFRPALVVGESSTGKTTTFNQSVYHLLRMWNQEIFTYFPIKNCFINTVFVDDLCKSIYEISARKSLVNQNYHTFDSKIVPLEVVLDESNKLLKFKKPEVVSRAEFMKRKLTPVQKALLKNNILIYNFKVKFDSTMTNEILKRNGFKFTQLNQGSFLKLLEYAVKKGFLIRK